MHPDRKCSSCGNVITLDTKICPYYAVSFSEETIALEKEILDYYYKEIRKKERIDPLIIPIMLILFSYLVGLVVYVYV